MSKLNANAKFKNGAKKKPNPIDELYFGCMYPTQHGLEPANLFAPYGVRHSIALYRGRSGTFVDSPLLFCFGDYWAKTQVEWLVAPWISDWDPRKVDIYEMYVQPNASLLLEMVDSITEEDAKAWLKERDE